MDLPSARSNGATTVGADLSGEFDVSATFVVRGHDDFRTYLFDPLHIAVDRAGIPMPRTWNLRHP